MKAAKFYWNGFNFYTVYDVDIVIMEAKKDCTHQGLSPIYALIFTCWKQPVVLKLFWNLILLLVICQIYMTHFDWRI